MLINADLLQAALSGYQAECARIEQAMAEIRRELGSSAGAASQPAARGKRTMSAAARKRIAAAQKKRWAEYHKSKQAPVKAAPAKKATAKPAKAPKQAKVAKESKAAGTSKKDQVLALISRKNGASLDEIMTATGWQKHTVRGFIAILGKKGTKIESFKSEAGARTYKAA